MNACLQNVYTNAELFTSLSNLFTNFANRICPPYFPRPFRGLYDKKRAKYHLMDALSSRVECMDP